MVVIEELSSKARRSGYRTTVTVSSPPGQAAWAHYLDGSAGSNTGRWKREWWC
jgi:hypothetical protein